MSFLLIIRCIFALSLFSPQEWELKPKSEQEQIIIEIDKLCQLSKKYLDSEPKKGISYGSKAIQLAKQTDNKSILAKAYNATGSAYYILGDYDQALNLYLKSLRLREKTNDSIGISASYNNIANIHNSMGAYDKALVNYKKSLNIASSIGDSTGVSGTLINIGNVYMALGKFDLSLENLNQSLAMKEKLGDEQGILATLINMGISNSGKGDQKLALELFNRALPLAEKLNSQHDKVYILRGKAEAYYLTMRYEAAARNALESLEIAMQYNGKDEIRISASVLNTIYTKIGNYTKAHEYLSLYNVYNDSIKTEQIAEKIALMQVKYETAQKEKENLKLRSEQILTKKEIESKNTTQFFIIILLVVMSLLAVVFFLGRNRLRHINGLLTRKNEQIMQSNLLLQQHQEAQDKQAIKLQTQKEELERLNTVKDKLFSVIGHDLRGPLVSLQGLLQVIAMGIVPIEKQQNLFQSLVKGQQNVLWMLDNLFDWARTQMNGFEAEKAELNIKELADENIRLLSPFATSKSVDLQNNIEENEFALADREMIRLVLRNLISNSIKFCHPGSSVSVSATKNQKDGMLTVAVKDTGVGISPETQQKLFTHSNFSTKGTANEKGSGLGLALCKEFIERNGGDIWVTSNVGEGSCFQFTLPLALSVNQNLLEEVTLTKKEKLGVD